MVKLQTTIVSDDQHFDSLAEEWAALLKEIEKRTPFMTHQWLSCWWRHFRGDNELRLILVREDGRLRGIAPLMKGKITYQGLHGTVLASMSNFHTGRVDLILAEPRERYLEQIFGQILAESWDMLLFYPVLTDSPTVAALQGLSKQHGYYFYTEESWSSPYVNITGDWSSFLQTLNSKKRNVLRSRWKRFQKLGEPRLVSDRDGIEPDAMIEACFEIAEKGWAAENGTAITSTAELRGFYGEFAKLAYQAGWMDLQVLQVNQEKVAFEYNLLFDNKIYNLKIGYDAAYSQYAPGIVFKKLLLSQLYERGVAEFDFLGEYDEYKRTFAQHSRPHSKVFILAPGLLGRYWFWMRTRFRPAVKNSPIVTRLFPWLKGLKRRINSSSK